MRRPCSLPLPCPPPPHTKSFSVCRGRRSCPLATSRLTTALLRVIAAALGAVKTRTFAAPPRWWTRVSRALGPPPLAAMAASAPFFSIGAAAASRQQGTMDDGTASHAFPPPPPHVRSARDRFSFPWWNLWVACGVWCHHQPRDTRRGLLSSPST